MLLKFSPANTKTKKLTKVRGLKPYLKGGRKVYSLDLLSGVTCPGAKDCHSKVVVRDGKRRIQDGKDTKFRCFSASQEVLFPALYNLRKHNTRLLRGAKSSVAKQQLLFDSLPPDCGILRYHVGGDFFDYSYLLAAHCLALAKPDILFYAYTKSLDSLEKLVQRDFHKRYNLPTGVILPNFRITASRGGEYDHLIDTLNVREAVVVLSNYKARKLKLSIDHDDSHAATIGGSFALLIHGTQQAGSDAAKAVTRMRGQK